MGSASCRCPACVYARVGDEGYATANKWWGDWRAALRSHTGTRSHTHDARRRSRGVTAAAAAAAPSAASNSMVLPRRSSEPSLVTFMDASSAGATPTATAIDVRIDSAAGAGAGAGAGATSSSSSATRGITSMLAPAAHTGVSGASFVGDNTSDTTRARPVQRYWSRWRRRQSLDERQLVLLEQDAEAYAAGTAAAMDSGDGGAAAGGGVLVGLVVEAWIAADEDEVEEEVPAGRDVADAFDRDLLPSETSGAGAAVASSSATAHASSALVCTAKGAAFYSEPHHARKVSARMTEQLSVLENAARAPFGVYKRCTVPGCDSCEYIMYDDMRQFMVYNVCGHEVCRNCEQQVTTRGPHAHREHNRGCRVTLGSQLVRVERNWKPWRTRGAWARAVEATHHYLTMLVVRRMVMLCPCCNVAVDSDCNCGKLVCRCGETLCQVCHRRLANQLPHALVKAANAHAPAPFGTYVAIDDVAYTKNHYESGGWRRQGPPKQLRQPRLQPPATCTAASSTANNPTPEAPDEHGGDGKPHARGIPPPDSVEGLLAMQGDNELTSSLQVELPRTAQTPLPQLMARLKALAGCNKVWHNGGLFTERPSAKQTGNRAVVSLEARVLKVTARGVRPFPWLYSLFQTVLGLLPELAPPMQCNKGPDDGDGSTQQQCNLDVIGSDEMVDVSFLRWLRVGVALKQATQELAKVVEERVRLRRERSLLQAAQQAIAEEEQLEAVARLQAEQLAAREAALQSALHWSVEAALRRVDELVVAEGGTVHAGSTSVTQQQPKVAECKAEQWYGHVKECTDDVSKTVLLKWMAVPPSQRHVIALKPLRTAIGASCRVKGDRLEHLVAVAGQALADELVARCSESALFTVDALAVKDAVLVKLQVAVSAPPRSINTATTAQLQCTCTSDGCAKQPTKDVLSSPCITCRGYAKAIKASHRKRRSLGMDNWRNCIPQHWSSGDVLKSTLALAKAFTSGGSEKVASFDDLDFAALVNVLDSFVGLYDPSDGQVWQPQGPNDDDGLLGRVLQPARRARNAFAHNARLAFDSEAAVAEAITALLALVEMLPVVAGSTTKQREEVVASMKRMMELGASDGSTGAEQAQDMKSQLSKIVEELPAAPVLAYMRRVCLARDVAMLKATMSDNAFKQGCASASLVGTVGTAQPPPPPSAAATGGAGQGAGAGPHTPTAGVTLAFTGNNGLQQTAGFDLDVMAQAVARSRSNPSAVSDAVMARVAQNQLRCLMEVQEALARVKSLEAWLKSGHNLLVTAAVPSSQLMLSETTTTTTTTTRQAVLRV